MRSHEKKEQKAIYPSTREGASAVSFESMIRCDPILIKIYNHIRNLIL